MKILEQNEETLLRTMDCNVVVMANLASENILETEHQQEIEAEIIPIKKESKVTEEIVRMLSREVREGCRSFQRGETGTCRQHVGWTFRR